MSDYWLFGIHYLILPRGRSILVAARLVECAGGYCLWTVRPSGYVRVGYVVGAISANRTNVGVRSIGLLRSHLAERSEYLAVEFDGARAGPESGRGRTERSAPGLVESEVDDLSHGYVDASLVMHHRGVAVLSASFDPGWQAIIDGNPGRVEMVAPALLATAVSQGVHRVEFRYRGFPGYGPLVAISILTLVGFLGVDVVRRRSMRMEALKPVNVPGAGQLGPQCSVNERE